MSIRVRELQRDDVPLVNQWRNDPRVIEHLGANFLFIGPEIDERWFDAYVAARDRAVRLTIEAEGRAIGCVNLTNIHPINRSAEFSIMIGVPEFWSKGYGKAATIAMLDHGFRDLNLNRIHLYVLTGNARAVKMYEAVGFRSEGRLRQAVFKNGEFHDELVMSMLRSEHERSRPTSTEART